MVQIMNIKGGIMGSIRDRRCAGVVLRVPDACSEVYVLGPCQVNSGQRTGNDDVDYPSERMRLLYLM